MDLNFFKYIKGNSASGIHLHIKPDGSWLIHLVILEKKKNSIIVRNNHLNILDLDELLKLLPKNIPILLSIEGKGIIHRQIKINEDKYPILQILPNVNPEDFLVQLGGIYDEIRWISIMRLEAIKEILGILGEKGYRIYDICLGPFLLNSIWAFHNETSGDYLIDDYKIRMQNHLIRQIEIVEVVNSSTSYSFGNETINSIFLIPYSNALTFFTGNSVLISLSVNLCKKSREEFHFKKIFQVSATIILVVIFCSLVINFLLFSRYNLDYEQSTLKFKSGLELVNHLNQLEKELKIKEELIKDNGLITASKFSFVTDKIASIIPNQVILTRLAINPVKTKLKADKELEIEHNCINISGECLSSHYLDNWIITMRKEDWIKNIEILQYSQESKEVNGKFLIRIEF